MTTAPTTRYTWQKAWGKSRVHAFPTRPDVPRKESWSGHLATAACGVMMTPRGESDGPRCSACVRRTGG